MKYEKCKLLSALARRKFGKFAAILLVSLISFISVSSTCFKSLATHFNIRAWTNEKCFWPNVSWMAFKFYHTRPNMIKYDQARSNSTKRGVQTVKCLLTKQCLMVFGRQAFLICHFLFFCNNHREAFPSQTKRNLTVHKPEQSWNELSRIQKYIPGFSIWNLV